MTTEKSYFVKVGGLLWSLDLLSGGRGHVNPDNGIYYYTQKKAIAEAEKQGLRLPTREEYQQFYRRTVRTWCCRDSDNQWGILFEDRRKWYNPFKRRNSIFFPALGYHISSDGAVYNVGTYGYYWSESVYGATNGYALTFGSGSVYPQNNVNRRTGFPVRCVLN